MTEAEVAAGKHHKIAAGYSSYVHGMLEAMLQVDVNKRASIYDILLMPMMINQVNQLETSTNFRKQMHETFLRRIDLGWCREKDIRWFQPQWPKTKKYNKN